MKVKFVDLPRQNSEISKVIFPLIQKVILNADFNFGNTLESFEKDFAKFVNKKYAVGLNSGTDALHLSLLAYGVGKNDEVIVPVNSYFSTAMVVSNLGAKPVFIDCDESFMIDVNQIESKITKKTKAIIPVHFAGQSANMDRILKIAKKHKLIIIEDACQAHGAKYKGKILPVSETGAFSFYPGKNLGAFGDGGAIVTDNPKVYEKLLYFRNDGSKEKYVHKMLGVKSRLDNIQAIVLRQKLKNLKKWNKKRQEHAELYMKLLSGVENIKLPVVPIDNEPVFHLFMISVKKRDELKKYLLAKGVDTVIHYPIPIHLQEPYKKLGYKIGDFPVAEYNSKHLLSIPMFPELKQEEIIYVVESLKRFFKQN